MEFVLKIGEIKVESNLRDIVKAKLDKPMTKILFLNKIIGEMELTKQNVLEALFNEYKRK